MEFKQIIDTILDSKYLKVIILMVAVLILFRNAFYLLSTDMTAIFSQNHQRSIKMIFMIEVPMLLMTVLWPVIFAILNRIHPSLKISSEAFIGVLFAHLFTCLFTAYLVFNNGCDVGEVCDKMEFNSAVWGGSALTLISVVISYWIYSTKSLFLRDDHDCDNTEGKKS